MQPNGMFKRRCFPNTPCPPHHPAYRRRHGVHRPSMADAPGRVHAWRDQHNYLCLEDAGSVQCRLNDHFESVPFSWPPRGSWPWPSPQNFPCSLSPGICHTHDLPHPDFRMGFRLAGFPTVKPLHTNLERINDHGVFCLHRGLVMVLPRPSACRRKLSYRPDGA